MMEAALETPAIDPARQKGKTQRLLRLAIRRANDGDASLFFVRSQMNRLARDAVWFCGSRNIPALRLADGSVTIGKGSLQVLKASTRDDAMRRAAAIATAGGARPNVFFDHELT